MRRNYQYLYNSVPWGLRPGLAKTMQRSSSLLGCHHSVLVVASQNIKMDSSTDVDSGVVNIKATWEDASVPAQGRDLLMVMSDMDHI